jgi:hypothetical protein
MSIGGGTALMLLLPAAANSLNTSSVDLELSLAGAGAVARSEIRPNSRVSGSVFGSLTAVILGALVAPQITLADRPIQPAARRDPIVPLPKGAEHLRL